MSKHPGSRALIPIEHVARSILVLRGQKVLLDADLASLYGVATKRFNEAVKRNRARFPADFAFQLTVQEFADLQLHSAAIHAKNAEIPDENSNWSQIATSSARRRGSVYRPWAFTEHGAIMAATILNSARAVEISVHVVRAFVKLRELLVSSKEFAQRVDELEGGVKKKLTKHARKLDTHEQAIVGIFKTLSELKNPPRVNAIGFTADLGRKS